MESLDKPPSYSVRKEQLGNHRKYWTVRYGKKFMTAFASKSDAQGWIYKRESTRKSY